jgi:hypothetical protein
MYSGKLVFAQIMDHLPSHTLRRCVQRYRGHHKVKQFSCLDQFRCMAFAQLTYRESLRDIEVCLRAQQSKLYHMGIRAAVARSTLADANQVRDWRIYADFAQSLIQVARRLYAKDNFGVELDHTVYALDSTTIDLCLSLFPWARFQRTKGAVKLHTLLDLRGPIPTFIHISDGKVSDVSVLDLLLPEAGAIYIMDRGYLHFERLYALHQSRAFFVTRAKSDTQFRRLYSHPVDKATGILCDQTIVLTGVYTGSTYPDKLRRIKYRDPDSGKTLVFLSNNFALPALTIAQLYHGRWGRAVLQMDQTTPAHQSLLRHFRERRAHPDLDRRLGLRAGRYHQKAPPAPAKSLHHFAGSEPHRVRTNAFETSAYWCRSHYAKHRFI